MSMASSREKLDNSPVKTKESPARQSGAAAVGMGFEPGLDGPDILAAFAAAQLKINAVRDLSFVSQKWKGLVKRKGGRKREKGKDSYLNLGFGLLLSLSSSSTLTRSSFGFPSTLPLRV